MDELTESARAEPSGGTPRIEYRQLAGLSQLPDDLLFAVGFGRAVAVPADPRCVRVGLDVLGDGNIVELWHATGRTQRGFDGPLRYVADAQFLAGAMELDERDHRGIEGAAQAAYASIRDFHARSEYPHVLRMWNYFDGINSGAGDDERYRRFCRGRAAGLGQVVAGHYPAATAIGRRDGEPMLQIYWLASRRPGIAVENPRQQSAYHYPSQYGPVAPSFSRAMLADRSLLLISGTASITGHASRHAGDVDAQLDETLTNLAAVVRRAASRGVGMPAAMGPASLLKIYLRDPSHAPRVAAQLDARFGPHVPRLLLAGDICRAELAVEIDCIHAG